MGKKRAETITEPIKPSEYLAGVTIIVAVFVIIGWITGITALTSIYPNWISMKITTAICFMLSGGIILILSRAMKIDADKAQYILLGLAIPILYTVLAFLTSIILGVDIGIEHIFIKDSNPLQGTLPGYMSIGTTLNFLMIAIIAIASAINTPKIPNEIKIGGAFISAIGLMSIIGYATNNLILSFSIPGLSNPLAVNTSILFVIQGAAFMLIPTETEKTKR